MKSKIIIISLLLGASLTFSSCGDFLDKAPDNRVEKLNLKQVQRLLVNAYTSGNYAVMCELSSDNMVDNQSPDEVGNYFKLDASSRWHEEAFAWKDIVSAGEGQDSPTYIWDGCYYAIAVANNALEAIERLVADRDATAAEVATSKAEALLCRAYHHFLLVNLFSKAYRNDEISKNDVGIPYMTKTEDKVLVHYERGNVTDTYDAIERDLLEGLALVTSDYTVPKYHFNVKAAHAFAARFYLYKRNYTKVVEHANIVLGSDALVMMRNWSADTPTAESVGLWWINSTANSNLMLLATGSWESRMLGRYACNRDAAKATIYGEGPTWSDYNFHPCYDTRMYYRGNQEYGLFFIAPIYEFFEYTDKLAGIGFGHIVKAEFTAEETLLCRAEANFFLNNIDLAEADLKVMDDSRKVVKDASTGIKIPTAQLTDSIIRSFYKESKPLFTTTTHTQDMSPEWTVNPANKAILDCILHYRRLETIFTGLRWFDIKRFGIEVTHKIGKNTVDVLKWDDPRRALQITPEAIVAGMDPNNRIPPASQNTSMVGVHLSTAPYIKTIEK
jgi:hypothetical protein